MDDRPSHHVTLINIGMKVAKVPRERMTVDLRGIPSARVGDVVTLWGPEIPVETIASAAGTIGYELTCSITRRVRFLER